MLAGNGDFYNLPRKFKISITECTSSCPYPEIDDVGIDGHGSRYCYRSRLLSARCWRSVHRTLTSARD